MHKLKLERRTFYGKPLYRPMCDVSKALITIQRAYNRKNPMFTKKEIETLKGLGYEVEVTVPPDESV